MTFKNKSLLCPIHIAAQQGWIEVVKLFLEAGCKIDQQDGAKWSPIYHAVYNRHVALAAFLLEQGAMLPEGAFLVEKEGEKYNCLAYDNVYQWALSTGDLDLLQKVIEYPAMFNYFLTEEKKPDPVLLLLAHAQQGDIAAFSKCVHQYNLNINVSTLKGINPLVKAIKFDQLDFVKYLVEEGVKVDGVINPLMLAIQLNKWTIASYLLNNTSVFKRCTEQETQEILIQAIKADQLQFVIDLVEKGVGVDGTINPFMLAVRLNKWTIASDLLHHTFVINRCTEEEVKEVINLIDPEYDGTVRILTAESFGSQKNYMAAQKIRATLDHWADFDAQTETEKESKMEITNLGSEEENLTPNNKKRKKTDSEEPEISGPRKDLKEEEGPEDEQQDRQIISMN